MISRYLENAVHIVQTGRRLSAIQFFNVPTIHVPITINSLQETNLQHLVVMIR